MNRSRANLDRFALFSDACNPELGQNIDGPGFCFHLITSRFFLLGVSFDTLGEPILFDTVSIQYICVCVESRYTVLLDSSVFDGFCSAAAAARSSRSAFPDVAIFVFALEGFCSMTYVCIW